jgi:hypothetical protein
VCVYAYIYIYIQGLTVGGSVGLIGTPFVLSCDDALERTSDSGRGGGGGQGEGGGGGKYLLCRLSVRGISGTCTRPKGFVHWLSLAAACRARVRRFGPLLLPPQAKNEILMSQYPSIDFLCKVTK